MPIAELKLDPASVEFSEIPVVVDSFGKGLMFAKNSKQWITKRAQNTRKTKATLDAISRQASVAAAAAMAPAHPTAAPSTAVQPPTSALTSAPHVPAAQNPRNSTTDVEFRGYRVVEHNAERQHPPGDSRDWLYQMPPELPEIRLVGENEKQFHMPRGELGRVRTALRQGGTKSVRIVEPEMPRMPTSTDAFYRVLGPPRSARTTLPSHLDSRGPPSMRSLPATHPAIRVPPVAIPREPVGRGSRNNSHPRPAFLGSTPPRQVVEHEPSSPLGHVDAEDSMDEHFAVHPAPRYYRYRSAAEGVAGPSNEVFLPESRSKNSQFGR